MLYDNHGRREAENDRSAHIVHRDCHHPGVDPATIQAVILAAGRGSRLKNAIDNGPKCLANVGGRPLIEHQLSLLAQAGIRRVAVVTGYRASTVRAAIGSQAEFIHNPPGPERTASVRCDYVANGSPDRWSS